MGPVVPDTDFSVVVCSGIFPSCSSSLVHVCTAAVCPPTAVFNSSWGFVQVSRIPHCLCSQPSIHHHSVWQEIQLGISYACMYIERAVPAADVKLKTRDHSHTVKDCKLYVGGEILFPLRLLLRTCRYEACCTASIPKACMYIHYLKINITL